MRFKALSLVTYLLIAVPAFAAEHAALMNPETSSVVWTGRKITGHHEGTLSLKKGVAYINNGTLASGNFEVDMTSLTVTDIKDDKYNKKLNDHLRSEDFFSVDKYPVAKFTITKIERIEGAQADQPNYTITGDLTIKDVTDTVSFPAVVTIAADSAHATATMKIDRTKYGIKYKSGQFFQNLGDKLIYDEFDVALDLKASIAK